MSADRPAPFLSAEETARRRAERGTPVVDVAALDLSRFEIPRRPMTAQEAVAAYDLAALLARLDRGYPAAGSASRRRSRSGRA